MKSSELAAIAGVSVRTLRHYHALGLLPEPPRHSNGYRDYSVGDLATVLHIRQLTSLGFPLSEIGVMMAADEGGKGSTTEEDALRQLDEELESQIARLQEQRRTIAQLREEGLDPALPPRFARVIKRFYGEEATVEAASGAALDYDRAALMVAARFYDEEALAELERFADKAEELGIVEELRTVERRIDDLAADASEEERAALTADVLELLLPTVECFDIRNWSEEGDGSAARVLESLLNGSLNDAQRDVEERIEKVIVERIREGAVEPHGCSEDAR